MVVLPNEGQRSLDVPVQKIEFPTIEHFLREVREDGILLVRLDVFHEAKQSELSFVYYVTLYLFATALDEGGKVIYEYMEEIGTSTETDIHVVDDELARAGSRRMTEVEGYLAAHGMTVRQGRYTMPKR